MIKKTLFLLLLIGAGQVKGQTNCLDLQSLYFLGTLHKKSTLHYNRAVFLDVTMSNRPPKNDSVKMGFLDKNGKVAIPAIYSAALDFRNGYADVIVDSTYGYIDKQGNAKMFPDYDEAMWYTGNLAFVKKDGKFGLINRNGDELVPPTYDSHSGIFDNIAGLRKDGKWIYFNAKGKPVFSDTIVLTGHTAFKGKIVFKKEKDGHAKKGLLNMDSEVIIKPKYNKISRYFNDFGLMKVQNNGKIGYVDEKGIEVIPLIYTEVNEDFSKSGLIGAQKDGKYGFIDKDNHVIIPFEYEKVKKFRDNRAAVKKNGKWGYINKKNNAKTSFIYEKANPFSENRASVKKDGNWFFINSNGKEKFQFKKGSRYTMGFSDGLRVFKDPKTGKFGFKNKRNTIKIEAKYDEALPFIKKMARVKLNGKYGYINKHGKIIIPIKYKELWDEREGLIRFVK